MRAQRVLDTLSVRSLASAFVPRVLTGRLFFVLALLVLAAGGLPHARSRQLGQLIKEGRFRPTPAALLEGVRSQLTNDNDMERYRAYAQAALGRPYSSYFVRTRAEWEAQFIRGEEVDSDLSPEVRPAAALQPYRDFLVEYPPAFFLVALPPALVAGGLDGYVLVFKLFMACCLALAVWCTQRFSGLTERSWLLWMGGAVLALGVVTTHRYDAAVTLGLCASMWAVARGRAVLGGVFIGAAIAIKGAPVLFMGPLLMFLFAEHGLLRAARLLFVAVAVVAISVAPVILSSGWALAEAFNYHRVRPLQIESMLGSLLGLSRVISRDWISIVHSFGSVNLAGRPVAAAGALSSVLLLFGLLCTYAVTWRRVRDAMGMTRRQAVADGIVLTGLAFMLFGKVFSPQYLTWILPLCVSAAVLHGGRKPQALIVLLAATQVIYPFVYKFVVELRPWAVTLVIARNVGLAIWAASLLRDTDAAERLQGATDRSESFGAVDSARA